MITHLHIQFILPDTEPPVQRDLLIPDSMVLDEINSVISICFGWPQTDRWEITAQQPSVAYTDGSATYSGLQKILSPAGVPISRLFQKNSTAFYYRGAQPRDRVLITRQNTTSVLPKYTLQLEHWQGENQPCSRACVPFREDQVEAALHEFCMTSYLLTNVLDREDPAEWNQSLRNFLEPEHLMQTLTSEELPEELQQLLDSSDPEEMDLLRQLLTSASESFLNSCTLEECLKQQRKPELADLLRRYQVSGVSKLRKDQMVQLLTDMLSDPELITQQLFTMTMPELELLEVLCHTNMPLEASDDLLHAAYLLSCGFCYFDPSGDYITLPEELRSIIPQLLSQENLILELQYTDILHTFCMTAAYFYGLWPVKKLLQKIRKITGLTVTEDDLQQTVAPFVDRDLYSFQDGWLLSSELMMDNQESRRHIQSLQKLQATSTDFFWPEDEQMATLLYQYKLIDENLYAAFANEFRPYLHPEEDMGYILFTIELWIRSGNPLPDLVHYLSQYIFTLPDEMTQQRFEAALHSIWEKTPVWYNCGYTPEQMEAKRKPKSTKHSKKQNRSKVVSLQEHRKKKKS